MVTKMIANLGVVDNWRKGGLASGQTALCLSHFLNIGTMVSIIGIFSEWYYVVTRRQGEHRAGGLTKACVSRSFRSFAELIEPITYKSVMVVTLRSALREIDLFFPRVSGPIYQLDY